MFGSSKFCFREEFRLSVFIFIHRTRIVFSQKYISQWLNFILILMAHNFPFLRLYFSQSISYLTNYCFLLPIILFYKFPILNKLVLFEFLQKFTWKKFYFKIHQSWFSFSYHASVLMAIFHKLMEMNYMKLRNQNSTIEIYSSLNSLRK